jgi:glutathione peroxidase
MTSVHDFPLTALDGGSLPPGAFAGRPMVIVNTASACGFTGQYAALQTLWQANRDAGLVVLGVPSNDFGGQEPGSAEEISAFCTTRFAVDFPLTEKTVVKGAGAHPLFKFLAAEGGFWSKPRWNFYKYLIGRDGRLKVWFSSRTSPDAPKFQHAVKRLLEG